MLLHTMNLLMSLNIRNMKVLFDFICHLLHQTRLQLNLFVLGSIVQNTHARKLLLLYIFFARL